jgi:soluble cytochrome b562
MKISKLSRKQLEDTIKIAIELMDYHDNMDTIINNIDKFNLGVGDYNDLHNKLSSITTDLDYNY